MMPLLLRQLGHPVYQVQTGRAGGSLALSAE